MFCCLAYSLFLLFFCAQFGASRTTFSHRKAEKAVSSESCLPGWSLLVFFPSCLPRLALLDFALSSLHKIPHSVSLSLFLSLPPFYSLTISYSDRFPSLLTFFHSSLSRCSLNQSFLGCSPHSHILLSNVNILNLSLQVWDCNLGDGPTWRWRGPHTGVLHH